MNEINQEAQQAINAKILSSLDSIHNQNRQIAQKIENLEQSVTKKATVSGAIAGAVVGTATSGMFSIGMEIVKAKFGG